MVLNKSSTIMFIGIVAIIAYMTPFLILGYQLAFSSGFNLNNIDQVQFLVSLLVSASALMTSFHLWSRVPNLEGQLKKLFLITGFTFISMLIIFCYLLINIILTWQGNLPIDGLVNSLIPQVEFDFFGIPGLTATMPADSFITFTLILFAISFYLFPIEKYVKQSTPWHTYSLFICTIIIPVLILVVPRDFPGSVYVMSILTTVIILWVIYNFFFLFYLYFSTGLKSPKGTEMRKASIMIGVGLLLFIFTWVAGWAIATGTPILDLILQMSVGGIAIFLFNYGFYLIRPSE